MWEGKGHDLRASIHDVVVYASEHLGHTLSLHFFTYGIVAAGFCCILAGYWEVIPFNDFPFILSDTQGQACFIETIITDIACIFAIRDTTL